MRIGDTVIWNGRRVTLLGLEPMSVPERLAHVLDETSGEELHVPVDELQDDEGLAPTA
jgi:hypothetical protein